MPIQKSKELHYALYKAHKAHMEGEPIPFDVFVELTDKGVTPDHVEELLQQDYTASEIYETLTTEV